MSSFTFQQFRINQQYCAMKVGTDGVLLGAWADVAHCRHILDMGTGTGLIALMLAQRSHPACRLSAVELNAAAARQAQQNVNDSPWQTRIRVVRQDIQTFVRQTNEKFDLIVSNPPYYPSGVACKSDERKLARVIQNVHSDWLDWAQSCLAENGKISFILPYDAAETLIKSTALFCIKQTDVITKSGKSPQRMLLTFSRNNTCKQKERLVIYNEKNRYTDEFIALTNAFYLKFAASAN